MNGFRKIFPIFLSHYATFFAKMPERKVVPFDEFYYQLKLMHLFQKHPVYRLSQNSLPREKRVYLDKYDNLNFNEKSPISSHNREKTS
jgi:hypothetical protein